MAPRLTPSCSAYSILIPRDYAHRWSFSHQSAHQFSIIARTTFLDFIQPHAIGLSTSHLKETVFHENCSRLHGCCFTDIFLVTASVISPPPHSISRNYDLSSGIWPLPSALPWLRTPSLSWGNSLLAGLAVFSIQFLCLPFSHSCSSPSWNITPCYNNIYPEKSSNAHLPTEENLNSTFRHSTAWLLSTL